MRFTLLLLVFAAPLLTAKEVKIRANIVQQCAMRQTSPAAGAIVSAQYGVEPHLDCQRKVESAKISKLEEQQWQRISIDY